MDLTALPKDPRELLPTDILFQTSFWSEVKRKSGWMPLAADYTSAPADGDVLVLTRPIGNGASMAYVPCGPERGPEPEDYGLFLESLSESLRPHLDRSVAFIRYDLPWDSPYADDPAWQRDAAGCAPLPGPGAQEMRMNFGTRTWGLRRAPQDLFAPDTIVIDLDRDPEALLAAMKPKTRYNIRLAERHGVRVEEATPDRLPEFYELYRATAERDGFPVHAYEHFAALFETRKSEPDSPRLVFLLAYHERDLLAGEILSICRSSATYLFGASSNTKRNLMAPSAVQWAAMLAARARGCTCYDLCGVAPAGVPSHPFAGLLRFKSGFGGRRVTRAGCWDFPLDDGVYEQFRTVELLR